MEVSINCLQIDGNYVGGVTTYTLGVLQGFAVVGNGIHFRVYVTSSNRHLFEQFRGVNNLEFIVVSDRLLRLKKNLARTALPFASPAFFRNMSNLVFSKLSKTMTADAELLYTPTVVLPYFNSSCPTVLSMHDIQHYHYPEFFSWPRRLSRSITYGLSAQYAQCIQASSNFIKNDLLSHFPKLTPTQIEVIPEGVDLNNFSSMPQVDLTSYRLPDRFLLCPAQLWPHKNHLFILRALRRLARDHGLTIPLVLTGAAFSAGPSVLRFVKEHSMDFVRYLGKVPLADLIALYHRASFLITASLHESSSLPILEAAATGVPIIASDIEPHRELRYDLSMNLFDPSNEDELVNLLLRLWMNDSVCCDQVALNRERVKSYSWESVARRYCSLFHRISACNN